MADFRVLEINSYEKCQSLPINIPVCKLSEISLDYWELQPSEPMIVNLQTGSAVWATARHCWKKLNDNIVSLSCVSSFSGVLHYEPALHCNRWWQTLIKQVYKPLQPSDTLTHIDCRSVTIQHVLGGEQSRGWSPSNSRCKQVLMVIGFKYSVNSCNNQPLNHCTAVQL